MEQPALGGRGEWVPICLSENHQFLGHILKSDLQGQKGINKTCINTFTEYFLANRQTNVVLEEQENSIKRVCNRICAEFSAAFGTFRGMFQGTFKVQSKQAEQNLALDSCDLALGHWQAQLQIPEK